MSAAAASISLAAIAAACAGGAHFLGGIASRRASAMASVIWMELVGLGPALVATRLTTGTWSTAALFAGLGIGVLAGAGLVCYYQALTEGAMAVTAPVVGAVGAAIPAVVGLLTGDRLRPIQMVGVGLAVVAIGIVGLQGRLSGSLRGTALALAAGVIIGVNFIVTRAGASGGAWTAVVARPSVACFVALAAVAGRQPVRPPRRAWAAVAGAGLLDTAAFLALLFAYRGGQLSVTTVVASLYPTVVVLLGVTVLRERLRRPQQLGVLLAIVAVVLISAG